MGSGNMSFSSGLSAKENLDYIETLYQQFRIDPFSLSPDWQNFFRGVEFANDGASSFSEKELDVYRLIAGFRRYGHLGAQTNPLANGQPSSVDQLKLSRFNLSEKDLETRFQISSVIEKPNSTLKDIISFLQGCYCGKLTVQCADSLPEIQSWFIEEFEKNGSKFSLTTEEKKRVLGSLTKTEILEKFIHTRYVGSKRFSIEGGDALIPMLEALVHSSSKLDCEQIVIGMAHRGRINVLANFMEKPVGNIFCDFNGPTELTAPIHDFDGDVKYHLGYSSDKKTTHGVCRITLAFNPSHLEAVNPVALGMTRAAQRWLKDTTNRKKAIPVLIHGDAAFSGQGIILETFQMAQVKGYTVGGTIHIIIDNQIGFTTNPENSRSTYYCSDTAKILGTPVLHVNGDDVESCLRAVDIATRFRQEWGRDIVINLVCYRRFGHNEGDEPAYTQPLMYEMIKKHPTPRDIYSKQLLRERVIESSYADELVNKEMESLQQVYEQTKETPPKIEPVKFEGAWKGLRKGQPEDFEKVWETKVTASVIKKVGLCLSQVPQGFSPHPKLLKLLELRRAMAEGKEPVDWGTAELLAYGSLIHEGHSVRLTGQDAGRGTFTHRHAVLYDCKTGAPYAALEHLNPSVEFCVYDSILSEYGVLGFEYGNAIHDPLFLTLWEAQFGDFANGAQIIIDQFLTAAEAKWQQMCGLVLLLPHGYEGQGPEHSSARLERFLQMCAQYNMQVMNLTTPAQIFHALRRQIHRPFRKPLIIMSPKSLLRHPRVVSSVDDLSNGRFQEVLPDLLLKNPKKVETLALCTGKLYYDLLEEREKLKSERTALVRIEQIYPTPVKQIVDAIRTYPNLKNVLWTQEEPENMGAYQYLYVHLSKIFLSEGFGKLKLHYVGRGERSSPATGSLYRHKVEQTELIKNALSI